MRYPHRFRTYAIPPLPFAIADPYLVDHSLDKHAIHIPVIPRLLRTTRSASTKIRVKQHQQHHQYHCTETNRYQGSSSSLCKLTQNRTLH